ncbi:MAG: hemerythrin family protein [Planctomycetes bacterium]|nr:hemerythrin family protein [Planctomycetota bacterium]
MIELNDKYSVYFSLIDAQRKQFISVINLTVNAENYVYNRKDILGILDAMTKYSQGNFETEKTYIVEFKQAASRNHKEEHMDFAFNTLAFYEQAIKGDYRIANEILEYLKRWLINHIKCTDILFASRLQIHTADCGV